MFPGRTFFLRELNPASILCCHCGRWARDCCGNLFPEPSEPALAPAQNSFHDFPRTLNLPETCITSHNLLWKLRLAEMPDASWCITYPEIFITPQFHQTAGKVPSATRRSMRGVGASSGQEKDLKRISFSLVLCKSSGSVGRKRSGLVILSSNKHASHFFWSVPKKDT